MDWRLRRIGGQDDDDGPARRRLAPRQGHDLRAGPAPDRDTLYTQRLSIPTVGLDECPRGEPAAWRIHLALGSLVVFVPALLVVAAVVARTALEDRTLLADLPGYAEYAQTTRYRLLPGIW